jgi:hypothetical protein
LDDFDLDNESKVVVPVRSLRQLVTSANESASAPLFCDSCNVLISENVRLQKECTEALATFLEVSSVPYKVFGDLRIQISKEVRDTLQHDFICNSEWDPFKRTSKGLEVNGSDDKLKYLNSFFGEEVTQAVLNAKKELLLYNPSGQYCFAKPIKADNTPMTVADLCQFYVSHIRKLEDQAELFKTVVSQKEEEVERLKQTLSHNTIEIKELKHSLSSLRGRSKKNMENTRNMHHPLKDDPPSNISNTFHFAGNTVTKPVFNFRAVQPVSNPASSYI